MVMLASIVSSITSGNCLLLLAVEDKVVGLWGGGGAIDINGQKDKGCLTFLTEKQN